MSEPTDPERKNDEPLHDEPEKKEEPSIQDQLSSRFEELKKNENVQKVLGYTRSNTRDSVAYVLLFIGLLLIFFQPFWGGLIIGAIGGFYFADPIIHWVRTFQEYLEREGLVKVLILSCVALGFLIVAPAFFLGAAGAIGIKFILLGEQKTPKE